MRRKPQQQASGTCKWPLVLVAQNEINPANQALRSHSFVEGQGLPANRRYSIAYTPLKKGKGKKNKSDQTVNKHSICSAYIMRKKVHILKKERKGSNRLTSVITKFMSSLLKHATK